MLELGQAGGETNYRTKEYYYLRPVRLCVFRAGFRPDRKGLYWTAHDRALHPDLGRKLCERCST
jgi:hypothetical protein